MAKNWKKDLEERIEAKTGTKDFANAAHDNALLQRMKELENAWKPLLEHFAYIGQTYQAGDKVFKACFDADKASNTINLYAGFVEPNRELGYLNADLRLTSLREVLLDVPGSGNSLLPADANTLQVTSWNGACFRHENKKDTFETSEADLLIKGINKYIADQVANGGLQKRHIKKDIDLSPKL